MANKLQPVSVRFTPELKARLLRLADAENRSLSNFIETELEKLVAAKEAEAKAKRK